MSSNTNPITMTTNLADFSLFVGDDVVYTGPDGTIHSINSYIYEVITYNKVLSQSQITQVHQYLQAKNNTLPLANNGNFTY